MSCQSQCNRLFIFSTFEVVKIIQRVLPPHNLSYVVKQKFQKYVCLHTDTWIKDTFWGTPTPKVTTYPLPIMPEPLAGSKWGFQATQMSLPSTQLSMLLQHSGVRSDRVGTAVTAGFGPAFGAHIDYVNVMLIHMNWLGFTKIRGFCFRNQEPEIIRTSWP